MMDNRTKRKFQRANKAMVLRHMLPMFEKLLEDIRSTRPREEIAQDVEVALDSIKEELRK